MRAVILGILVGLSGFHELLGSETPVPEPTEGVSTTSNVLKLGSSSDTTTAELVTLKTSVPSVSPVVQGVSAGHYGGYSGPYQAYKVPTSNYYNAETANPMAAGRQYGGYGVSYGGYGAGTGSLMGMRALGNMGSYGSPYESVNQASSANQSPMNYYYPPYSSWTAMKGGINPSQFDYAKYQSSLNQFSKPGINDHRIIKTAGRIPPRAMLTKPGSKRIFNIDDAIVDNDDELSPPMSTTKTVKNLHSRHNFHGTTTRAPCEKYQRENIPAASAVPAVSYATAVPSITVKPTKPKKSFSDSLISFFGK